jgi:hypothetical protein
MKKNLLLLISALTVCASAVAQNCSFDRQITTSDSVLCNGDSTLLAFPAVTVSAVDSVIPTPIVNNNGQDGNMFNVTAANSIRITYFEALIANTPNPTTQYYIYYKVGTHVGFENNAAAWTLLAGPLTVTPNAPNTMTVIPYTLNMVIPAGQTYAYYLTNTAAASNNNRYHNGTATGNVLSTNSDLTVYEGTGGAYPFGTFFNARPWEGIIHYDIPPTTYLWNTGATTTSISVQPSANTSYSCVATVNGLSCTIEDTIDITVNPLPVVALGNDTTFCSPGMMMLDAGNSGSLYAWCSGNTTQTLTASTSGAYCVTVIDPNGCVNADTISLTVNAQPFIAALGDSICEGSIGTMYATGSASVYNWNPGPLSGNVVTDSPVSTTTYTIVGTDANGCTDTTNAVMVVNPLSAIAISSFGTYCFDDQSVALTGTTPLGGSYSGPGVSNDSLYPSVSGVGTFNVTYTYTDANGCTSMDSSDITIDLCLGLNETETVAVSVYPNPMNQSAVITISNAAVLTDASFALYNVNGEMVRAISNIASHTVTMEREGLASGVYFYTLVNKGTVIGSGKIIVE